MIHLAEESVAEVLESIGDTFTSHWKEVEDYQEEIPFNPDYNKYYALETAGALYVATAREEGELIGYLVFIVDEPLHHQDCCFAVSDLIYLNPEYRKTGLAKEMIEFAEQGLAELGIEVVKLIMKSTHPFEKLTTALGYTETERIQSKFIGKKE